MTRRLNEGPQIFFAPAGDPPPADPPADPPPADPPADPPPADPPADPPPADPPADPPPADPPAKSWWEGDGFSEEQRTTLTASGLTVEDPLEAVAKLVDMEQAAQRRLGQKPEDLMTRPAPDGDIAEWLREHGDTFGIPKDAEGYDVKPPEDWPKDAKWNADLEGRAREIALKHGHNSAALQDYVGLFAGEVAKLNDDAGQELAAANTDMMTSLQKDWGDQTNAKIALARQASGVLAEAAGLDPDAVANIASVLKPKIGDANTIKLFAALAENMGEDLAAGLTSGAQSLGSTPAEARAELAKMRAEGGDYYKASASDNRAELTRLKPIIERLSKIAAQK